MEVTSLNGHAVFSPSASKMWLGCPASLHVNLKARLENAEDSKTYSDEGKIAHQVAEEWLKTGKKPIHLINTVVKMPTGDVLITEEMLSYVAEYVAMCQSVEGEKFVEFRVDFSHLTPIPDQFGTIDHVCCSNDTLTITDLKYGLGVKVDAENNTQLQIYALGCVEFFNFLYDFKKVVMRICQPRRNHISEWEISIDELLTFGEKIRQGALTALNEPNKYNPSLERCQFCRGRATCTANAQMIEAAIDEKFADCSFEDTVERIDNGEFATNLPDVSVLNDEQLEKVFLKTKQIKLFLDAVEKKVFDNAMKGSKMHHIKLVRGRKTRSWQDEATVVESLAALGLGIDDIAPRTLVTPAKAEKLLKRAGIPPTKLDEDGMIANRQGSPTLVPISDPRPAFEPDAGVDWGDSE